MPAAHAAAPVWRRADNRQVPRPQAPTTNVDRWREGAWDAVDDELAAVATAARFGVTLVGFLRAGRFTVYSHPERLVGTRRPAGTAR